MLNKKSNCQADVDSSSCFGEYIAASHTLVCQSPLRLESSDGPSRFHCSKVLAMGATEIKVDGKSCWDELTALAETWGEYQAVR